ncbi:hypothetical protein ERX37_02525 [Macrococcus hajekii]|uniref:Uncharacterized protein n=1 Tax=Macrococcus hajekii TaxID=198482 RepID=A0A4R6BMS4_9STAP|nr:hypothetical protein [Macrococcus hajekii]TDM02982.1 hypothetical protein ERX37_02525 [Macrococcus hajekii]GGB05537.1 hypothetical protein GCM10007190_11970 [Macrococcus hajekii]
MDFFEQYRADNLRLEKRHPLYRCPEANIHIVRILEQLTVPDNIKKSILAIDSAMRLGRQVKENNKEAVLLATDLLSAQFYHYNAEGYNQQLFTQLTAAVMTYNMLKSSFDQSKDASLIPDIEAAFIKPFLPVSHPAVQTLISHSELYTK